jgi:hypothetical protein
MIEATAPKGNAVLHFIVEQLSQLFIESHARFASETIGTIVLQSPHQKPRISRRKNAIQHCPFGALRATGAYQTRYQTAAPKQPTHAKQIGKYPQAALDATDTDSHRHLCLLALNERVQILLRVDPRYCRFDAGDQDFLARFDRAQLLEPLSLLEQARGLGGEPI